MSYDFDQKYAGESYETNQQQSNLIQLPFDAPFIAWRHGNPDAEPGTSKYFGRWGIDIADWDKVCESLGIAAPPEFETHPVKDGNYVPVPGEYYKIYSWRFLIFAPIGTRTRWIENKNGKKFSQSQSLVYLATKAESGLVPQTPAILTARSWTSNKLKTGIGKWMKFIGDFETGIPAHFFYCAIGTFGDESKFAGSHGKETYPQLFIRDGLNKDNLPYVGSDMTRTLAEMRANSLDWLNDENWITPGNMQDNQGYAKRKPQGEPAAAEDDEIPF